MVLPALVLLVLGLTTGVVAAAVQIRCVDAAQAGARAAARGEPAAAAVAAAHNLAPRDARAELGERGGLVRFRVAADVRLPGLHVRIPVEHTAVVAQEGEAP
jgi:hypothetical protein